MAEQRVVEDPVLRQRLGFERTTDEQGDLLRVDMWVDPGGGVPPHVHPAMEERFTVQEGRCSFLSGRKWTEAGPGEVAFVPPGTRHAYRNRSDGLARVVCEARPPSTLQEFLEDTAAMSRAGLLVGRWAIPKGLTGLLQGAVLAHHHREMVALGFPLPPPAVQRLVFPPLVRMAERRGYRPGQLGDRAPA